MYEEKQVGGNAEENEWQRKRNESWRGPGLTRAPRSGSSMAFLNRVSITESTEVHSDSSAPTEEACIPT